MDVGCYGMCAAQTLTAEDRKLDRQTDDSEAWEVMAHFPLAASTLPHQLPPCPALESAKRHDAYVACITRCVMGCGAMPPSVLWNPQLQTVQYRRIRANPTSRQLLVDLARLAFYGIRDCRQANTGQSDFKSTSLGFRQAVITGFTSAV